MDGVVAVHPLGAGAASDAGRGGRADTVAVIGGTAVLCGTWVAVKRAGAVPAWEERVFRRVNGLPDALWPFAWAPMQLGSLAGSLGVVALTSAVSRDRRLRIAALGASQGAWWAGKVVKVLVARERPEALLVDVDVRETASGLGFLSGHAAIAFALASVLAPSVPRRWHRAPFVAAAAVAFGRVYAGAHLPIDVIGGAGLGLLSGGTARWLASPAHPPS